MKKLLFIEGYDAINYDETIQSNITKLFPTYNVTFFYFENNAQIDDVLYKLKKNIMKHKYNVIIAHSTGGLLLKTITSKIQMKATLIFTNALLTYKHNNNFTLINFVPLSIVKIINIPRFIRLPLQNLTSGILPYIKNYTEKSQYNFDNVSIIKQAFLVANDINFNKKNIYHIIYGQNDLIVPYNKEILNMFKDYKNISFYPIKSKHEPFNDTIEIQTEWRSICEKIINS